MTTPLWTFWTRDSRHWFSILWVRTQYDRPERNQRAQLCGDALLPHCLLAISYLPETTVRFYAVMLCCCACCVCVYYKYTYINNEHAKPPVTSHIWVMTESSVGTLPSCSLSGLVAPGNLSTNANRRWSQRKGSLVSSLPTSGEFRGRYSWRDSAKEYNDDGTVALQLQRLLKRFTNPKPVIDVGLSLIGPRDL